MLFVSMTIVGTLYIILMYYNRHIYHVKSHGQKKKNYFCIIYDIYFFSENIQRK